ncbi:hypothetical protein J7I80_11650 [Bacillus sp. ISL-41]|uniref:group I intron-associated PD-(D/E)XK endonuclease n=1 Tax=Bacillus sp. ISL-41 TaxID=2819127 RepID=UPI001BE8A786|nr:group I intron-associated PD-(D/E)XK endonuclease [Bacillus sp. ISL-41]MBT2642883.1 hypothetical protein [Bacillus sp. ISL-41]
MSYEVYESESIQSLFLKLAFIFKQINLDVYLPPTSCETVQLRMPEILSSENKQVGSIQYGGVKYPITPASKLNLKYVELRLDSTFLREMKVFSLVHNLIDESDANGWLKYKFATLDEIKLARRVAAIISKGMERKYGLEYLTIGMDLNILELPRAKSKQNSATYNQDNAIRKVSDLLMQEGYTVSRSSQGNSSYHLMAAAENGRSARILVRHLQYDSAYNNSTIPYQVYKIDAFEKAEEHAAGVKKIDIVVGYNFKDDCFACLDIKDFFEKKSRVVHQKEGLKSEFYNSWHVLDDYLRTELIVEG